MGKKNKSHHQGQNQPGQSQKILPANQPIEKPLISKRGWKVIGGGIGLAILGYFVLSKTDPMGQNWASNVSPFLILGGYVLIAIGIVLKEPTA